MPVHGYLADVHEARALGGLTAPHIPHRRQGRLRRRGAASQGTEAGEKAMEQHPCDVREPCMRSGPGQGHAVFVALAQTAGQIPQGWSWRQSQLLEKNDQENKRAWIRIRGRDALRHVAMFR